MKKKALLLIILPILLVLGLAIILVGGSRALGDVSVEVADRYGYADATLDDGTIVEYIGDLNETFGASGSGVFDSFVRLQGKENKTDDEKGYNTDGDREWDTKAGNFTHSILLSEIPTVIVGGELYWEFWSDINDSDSTPLISLDDFELYLTDDPNLTGYPFTGNADLIYDYTAANDSYYILINDVNQGSGRGDLRYLVPQDTFDLGDCTYGNPACTTYLVLYSVWGGKNEEYKFDGGFEEWKVKKYPILQVSKDINGAYDTPVTWTITKEFDGEYYLFAGETVTHDYEVSVDPIFGDPENTVVYGTITIVGDEDDPVDATITDMFNGAPATITGCSVTQNLDGTYTIAAGATVTCSYELSLVGAPVDGTNLARATYDLDGVSLAFQGSADILAGDYVETLTGDPDITVDDDNLVGEDWSASASSEMWSYTSDFSCPTDLSQYQDGIYSFTHENTATINETGQSDNAIVTVHCYALDVTKTADEFYTRYFEWDITKSVEPENWDLFSGESGTSEYTVNLIQTGFTENDWQVKGSITIDNPHPTRDAELTQVLDDAGGIGAPVDCDENLTVPAGGSLVCTYDTGAQDSEDNNPFGDLNTATATQQLYDFDKDLIPTADGTKDYSASHAIDFSEATVELVDEEATVSDTYEGSTVGGTYTDDEEFTYSRTFTCDGDEGQHDNTASFITNDTETTDSDSASVTVNCYSLEVTKTADEYFTRKYEWKIMKDVDDPGPIQVVPGDDVTVNYTVEVDLLSTTDNYWQVSGSITIANSHPDRDADLTQVLDDAGGITGIVDCPSLTVPAGDSLVCTYATNPQDSPDDNPFGDTNTATATQQLYDFDKDLNQTADGTKDYSGTWPIDFSEATVDEVDEMVTVEDDYAGVLGTCAAGDAPCTFNYPRTITAPEAFCGEVTVDNIATFTTNDTETTGSDDASVIINVPCEGCTPGFWQGGAGAPLWNEASVFDGGTGDPDWPGILPQPFSHDTKFNDFFNVLTDSDLDGFTMYDLVSNGGGSNWAEKAARDMVAAYLNESAFPGTFPADDLAELESMWYDAVANGDSGYETFHNQVSGWNSPEGGYCPLP